MKFEDFVLHQRLGTGSFGSVYKALYVPTNQVCAIKRIDMDASDDDIGEIQREIAILSECQDSHITRYFGCFVHEYELWIVMEFLGGGSVLDIVREAAPGGLSEPAIAQILADVLDGLGYLHARHKIHRDIKAANVLVGEEGQVKIADFGVAAQLSPNLSRRNTFVGTPFWMAPEVIDQQPHTFPADIWSLGITAMEIANGVPPLAGTPPMRALVEIPKRAAPRLDARFSVDFQDFIKQCLQKKPEARSSVVQLRQHPFLSRASRPDLVRLVHQHLHQPQIGAHLETQPNVASPQGSASTLTPETETAASDIDGDNDWDFGTIKGQPSLDELLANPPPGIMPTPPPSAPDHCTDPGLENDDELTVRTRHKSGLVRIMAHAARKFHDPLLSEISDMLSTDPLTVGIESYVVKRIGRLAAERYDLQLPREPPNLDAVEQVLFERWLEELL